MEEFRKRGYIVGSVERRKRFPARGKPACRVCRSVPMVDISHDLWNVFDLIACRPKSDCMIPDQNFTIMGVPPVVLVQTTSASNHAARRTKILASAEARFWLMSGGAICIQSWRKKNNRWQFADEWIAIEQFPRSLPETVDDFYAEQKRLKSGLPPASTFFQHEGISDADIPF